MTKSILTIDKNGTLFWRNEKGKIHREDDRPAVIFPDGAKKWFINGKCHRDNDQPAVIVSNGYRAWYVNGNRHREDDKPAVVHSDGYKEWWVSEKLIKEGYD